MKRNIFVFVLLILLVACGESLSDKDFLLGFVKNAETSIIGCKDLPDADGIADCMKNSMQVLQSDWTENLDKLQAMDDAEAGEVIEAYMQLSRTIQQEMMKVLIQQNPETQ